MDSNSSAKNLLASKTRVNIGKYLLSIIQNNAFQNKKDKIKTVLPQDFQNILSTNKFFKKTTHLIFGDNKNFSNSFDYKEFYSFSKLKTLDIRENIKKSITNLPKNLKILIRNGADPDVKIDYPSKLKKLIVLNYEMLSTTPKLPISLKTLKLYCLDPEYQIFPNNLTKLVVDNFEIPNQQIFLPDTLKILKLTKYTGCLPKLPKSLRKLILVNNLTQILLLSFPKKLRYLKVKGIFFENVVSANLIKKNFPKSLRVLEITEKEDPKIMKIRLKKIIPKLVKLKKIVINLPNDNKKQVILRKKEIEKLKKS